MLVSGMGGELGSLIASLLEAEPVATGGTVAGGTVAAGPGTPGTTVVGVTIPGTPLGCGGTAEVLHPSTAFTTGVGLTEGPPPGCTSKWRCGIEASPVMPT